MLAFLLLLQLVRIPATTVQADDASTGVAARVTIEEFLIAPTETTQAEFEEVMGFNPAHHRGPKRPVENVTWWDAIRYCNLRSVREGLEPCYDLATGECDLSRNGYRLPTNAEWEAALGKPSPEGAQLGTTDTKDAGRLVRETLAQGTRDVGAGKPNAHGVYDMIGNVWEWCQDWHNPAQSPAPAALGVNRIIRGGSFISTQSRWARVYKSSIEPREHSRFTGFRVVRSAGGEASVAFPANWHQPYQQVPPAFANQTGSLSPLVQGVANAKQWPERRESLRKRWMEIVGRPAIPSPGPEVRLIRESEQPL
jgi:formylglycine-generating enzyme